LLASLALVKYGGILTIVNLHSFQEIQIIMNAKK